MIDTIPILETRPPFVIKVYDTFFNISWDGLSDKVEDNYPYEKIKSITFKEGQITFKRSLLSFFSDIIDNQDSDELLIEFKTGETERRYFQYSTKKQHIEAIELIKTKIPG